MFYRGETVRHSNLGFGEVIVTGENPWVSFTDGLQRQVAGNIRAATPPSNRSSGTSSRGTGKSSCR